MNAELVDYISFSALVEFDACAVSLGVASDGLPILATIDWRNTEAPEIDIRDLAYRACTGIAHLPKHVLSYAVSEASAQLEPTAMDDFG
jgi:hypothetical protein